MNQFVESVKRLYQDGMLDKEKILELKQNGKLTIEDINYILEAH
jgi:hypothetical protein